MLTGFLRNFPRIQKYEDSTTCTGWGKMVAFSIISWMEAAVGFDDRFRMSAHAVITNGAGEVLMLKATYGRLSWGFPGGALDPGETVHEALHRECREELDCDVGVRYLSGIYHHRLLDAHGLIFRCDLPEGCEIRLSEEHSEWRYLSLDEMSPSQRKRVEDCLAFDGTVRSATF